MNVVINLNSFLRGNKKRNSVTKFSLIQYRKRSERDIFLKLKIAQPLHWRGPGGQLYEQDFKMGDHFFIGGNYYFNRAQENRRYRQR